MARRGILVGGALVAMSLTACATAAGKGPTVIAGPTTTVGSSIVEITPPTTVSAATDTGLSDVTGQPSTSGPKPRPELTDNRVFLEGDSITESVGPRYSGTVCDALEPLGWNVTVDAGQGRNTGQAVQSMRSHLSSVGQVLVILIGHNDGIDPGSYHDNIARLIKLTPNARWILLLTNYEFERGRDRMNLVLYDIANSDDRIQIVDWNDVVKSTKGAIKGDGLHLTSVGEEALAETIAGALGAAPAAPPGSVHQADLHHLPQPEPEPDRAVQLEADVDDAGADGHATPPGPRPRPPTLLPPTRRPRTLHRPTGHPGAGVGAAAGTGPRAPTTRPGPPPTRRRPRPRRFPPPRTAQCAMCGAQRPSYSAIRMSSRFSYVTGLVGSTRSLYSRNDCSRAS